MPKSNPLRRLTELCLSFPEATVERHGSHATFRVRKKVFAYFLDDHHGDGIVAVCVKTRLGENGGHEVTFKLTHDPLVISLV